ncbi:MAG TPA: homoserine kinase [Burkholderiaceae bacterium]
MAVFTAVSADDLRDWIAQFPLGALHNIEGIASGIENSNFFITTDAGTYVLTIFERLNFEQLPFYLNLMRHLAERGIPVPKPVANADGAILTALHGKPAAIVSKLHGRSQMDPQPPHCAQVGAMLAKMHLAGRDFPDYQPNLRGYAWWQHTAPVVAPFLAPPEAATLASEMQAQSAAQTSLYAGLQQGPVHADLFRNNVMFDGDTLSGFFDFYFAGCDTWLFDVAVTLNDWCIDLDTGAIDMARADALLAAYHAERPFTDAERQAWPTMLRAAALRFWLSRLYDFYLPREAEILTPHDPNHFLRILRARQRGPLAELPQ